jgi:cobalt-zinc-cadmium efflux system protein
MSHNHNHGNINYNRIFLIAIILNVAFVIIEVMYGYWSGSLALVADAGHNLSDVFSLGLGWGASILSQRLPSPKRTYGLRRSTILAALANSVILLVAVGGIAWESIQRVGNPVAISGETVIWVAALGIFINAFSAVLFLSGRNKDLNIKGALLHLATDAGVSLGVVLAGFAILLTGWTWLDPIISLLIVGIVLYTTWDLLRSSVNLALDAVPEGIDPFAVEKYFKKIKGVEDIHDLHIWGMSTTEAALTVHLLIPKVSSDDELLNKMVSELHDKFGIEHATIQIERTVSDESCRLAPADVV